MSKADAARTGKTEKLATDLNTELDKHGDRWGDDNVIVARKACENFIEEVLKLPKEQQLHALKRAQQLNDAHREKEFRTPGLNIVFADLDQDGKREELSDFKLNYFHQRTVHSETIENLDLYDPPRK